MASRWTRCGGRQGDCSRSSTARPLRPPWRSLLPLPKVQATEGYGAEVVPTGETFDDVLEASQQWAAVHDAVFVHPFDHADIVAGQATIALELLEQVPDV